MNYKTIQETELSTWNIEDPIKRREKAQRETARYPMLAKQMGLGYIDTSWMKVADIGAGPLQGVSSVINCAQRDCYDPLAAEYGKYFNTQSYYSMQGEELNVRLKEYDLIISTNCIDHFEDPEKFLSDLAIYMKPGAFFAHFHAIDNAISHPHEAHQWNINEELVKKYLYNDFELVWELTFKKDGLVYSWLKQPAFSQLWRKTTGY